MSLVDQSFQHSRGLHETIPCIPSHIDPILQVLETGYCVSRRGTNSKCGFANTAKKSLVTIFLFSIKRLCLKRERENQIVKISFRIVWSRGFCSVSEVCMRTIQIDSFGFFFKHTLNSIGDITILITFRELKTKVQYTCSYIIMLILIRF